MAEEHPIHCEHAARCGGCPAIALPYSEQLALKRGRVVAAINRYRVLETIYTEPTLPAEPVTGYRTRAKLMVGPHGEIGLYAKGGGHIVVDVCGCRVLAPVLTKAADAIRARLRAGRLSPWEPGKPGALRSIDLREIACRGAEPRVLVTLCVQRVDPPDEAALIERLRYEARELLDTSPEIIGVSVNFHEDGAVQVLGSETRLLAGEARANDEIGLATTIATFGSFVQAHRGQAARVHELAIRALRGIESPKVLDLYGGSGAIALALASAGAEVHLVDSFAPAVHAALEAARRVKLAITAECGDAASALRALCERQAKFDVVVMNPPRRGVSPEARELGAKLGAARLVYISCDPETLGRDLDHLARLGYSVASLQPLDMIPLTDEVETIAVLRRTGLAKPWVHYEDDDVLIVEKGAHEPTTPQGEYAHSLLDRVRLLAPHATPVHRLDVGTSGLVVFARHPSLVAPWQKALSAQGARKIYLAAARGVTQAKGAIARELREDGELVSARTRYRRLAVAGGHSVLRVVPEQGKNHQIRRHLAFIGHPVLGDARYGHPPTNRFFEEKHALDRTFLHCLRIELDHPKTGWKLVVESPVPGDLRMVLERLAGTGTLRFLEQKNALGAGGVSSIPPTPTNDT